MENNSDFCNSEELATKTAETSQPSLSISISDDAFLASITLVKRSDTNIPSMDVLLDKIKQSGIVKGVSKKRIKNLRQHALQAKVGDALTRVIAKGLLAKTGKNSYIKPLVPNALDRILAPQSKGSNKVNMRNLGDIICVAVNTPVAQQMPPSCGREGYTVKGEQIPAISGIYTAIKLGVNTLISPTNEHTIIAAVAGQPKFSSGTMSIDDTFIAPKGVNVGSGNIKYDGAVIVHGDVTENMEIIAKGDVTINGFVESAYIRSGGDIIITQGATGKVHHEDCLLIASGSIFIEHAQGLDIVADKNLTVAKQLAYSRVKVKGGITVGDIHNPMGNLFASTISCGLAVKAGSIGAISGSELRIDFSSEYTLLQQRQEALLGLFTQLSSNNATHELKLNKARLKHLPEHLQAKLRSLNSQIEEERALLKWIEAAQDEAQESLRKYKENAFLTANKELFPGVKVILNQYLFTSSQEYRACQLVLDDESWECLPSLS